MSSDEKNLLSTKIKERQYLKDQYIVQHGDICDSVNFIISGFTKTFYVNADGQEHIVMFAVEDWWTSDLGSFTSQTPADFNIQCLEPTQVVQFSYNTLQELYKEIPKLNILFRIITERAYVASQKRIIRNFSMTAKARYLLFKDTYPAIENRVPQYMIASYLGITKEFLSKIKRQLAQER